MDSLPDDCILGCLIFSLSFHTNQLTATCVEWSRNLDLNLLSDERGLKVGLKHNFDLHFCSADFSDQRNDSKRKRNVFCDPVSHELILAVGGYETDGVFGLKFREFDALVELTVVYCNGRLVCGGRGPGGVVQCCRCCLFALTFHCYLVVNTELAFRHSGEV